MLEKLKKIVQHIQPLVILKTTNKFVIDFVPHKTKITNINNTKKASALVYQ